MRFETENGLLKEGGPLNFKKWIAILATWFGLGKAKKAPGTFGTVGAIPLAMGLYHLGPISYMAATFLFILFSIFISQAHEKELGHHDASEIVIDEVAGFLVTMTWLPMGWRSLGIGFVVFRLLDIWKPFPISYLDKKIDGGLGVVIDDVVAGLIANIFLQMLYAQTNWLGEQFVLIGTN
jgi:phosphatidylglycerophosphatase A